MKCDGNKCEGEWVTINGDDRYADNIVNWRYSGVRKENGEYVQYRTSINIKQKMICR